jgi:hypothetical protein
MHKLLTVTAAVAALTISAAAAQADCVGNHNAMASKAPAKEVVAISTYDGAKTPPAIEEDAKKVEAAVTVCAEGDKNCAAGTK